MKRALACAAILLLTSCREPAREWPANELRSGGRPVVAALASGEVHHYRLPLQEGSLLRLVLDQQGIDAVVALDDPDGVRVLEADRPISDRGPELVLAVADRSGDYRLEVRGLDGSGPGRYEARIVELRQASAADRRSAEAYRLFTGAAGQEENEAMASRKRALATWRQLGEVALEAEALDSLARMHYGRDESQPAAVLWRAAAAAFARAGDRRREAMARANLGGPLLDLGAVQAAADQYALALPRAHQEGDRLTEAKALHGLGQAFRIQGELQKALDHFGQALDLWPKGDRRRPQTLHELGVLYARYLHEESRGGELLREARDSWPESEPLRKAVTLSQLGRLAYEQGRLDEARSSFEEALALRSESDPCGNALILARLALVAERQRERAAAEARKTEAMRIVAGASCPYSEPAVHLLVARLAEERGDPAAAHADYSHCATLFAGLGDRMGTAESLTGIARSARSLGDRQAARDASRRALDIVEGVRPTVLSEDLRTSFFSGARQAFDFHVDLLREMGAEEEAWATAEEARARVLLDLLAESGAGLRRDADPGLAARERALQRQLNVLESRRLAIRDARAEELRPLRREIEARIAELEALRGEIRRHSTPLGRPEPVTLAATRRELLDADTVLLEYHLGEATSTVWAVTRDAMTAARLPPRLQIEPVAREAARWMRSLEWTGDGQPPVLCELSRMLLAPVAPALGRRRLVVVADGALEALSFAALPVPADPTACPTAPALVEAHEVVSLPSVATLLTQRRLLAGRRPAPGWLAIVADPVHGSAHLRLPETAREARDIAALLPARRPAGKAFVATGAAASRQTVTGGALRGFLIVHFAVHGVLDSEHPLLSALALADGALHAHEIYDLDLQAELVVLSACETALGREVPGEGLVSGLPRAFLYAGAARVLVSLWPVEDRSTRELMAGFYRGLFVQGLPPARALREAQLALRHAGRAPSQWAGFVLLGDWRPLPPFS